MDIPGSKHSGVGASAPELGDTANLEGYNHRDESANPTICLDRAGAHGRAMSRHLEWSAKDTRSLFLYKVAELFPGKVIQQVKARLPHGIQVMVQATGPEEEWEMVREEWLKRLAQPSKKEPSATVYLIETGTMTSPDRL